MEPITAYPLKWPASWPRTHEGKNDTFKVSMGNAVDELYRELDLLGAENVIVSSNMQLRLDGRPLAKSRVPEDPGIAIYFTLKGKQQCIPCDKWNSVLGNVRAIGLTVAALRGLDRWGAKEMVDAAFQGFQALPAGNPIIGEAPKKQWWEILGVGSPDAPKSYIKERYRYLAHEKHPDKGGSVEEFKEIKAAYDEGMAR